jgi:hypothetical protein
MTESEYTINITRQHFVAIIIILILIFGFLYYNSDEIMRFTNDNRPDHIQDHRPDNIQDHPNRPDHPKWYTDLPEEHPDVQSLYTESIEFAKQTKQYTDIGYTKLNTPLEIQSYLNTVCKSEDRTKEGKTNIFARTSSGPPPYLIVIPDPKKKWIEKILHPMLEKWAGIKLVHSASYGPREYRKGSALRGHVDRDSHIISVIIHIGRDPEELPTDDWALEVTGHNKIKKNIFMKPGEMVFYESRSVMHSRETPNPYDYYRNIFLHWRPA